MKKLVAMIAVCWLLSVVGGCQNQTAPTPDTPATDTDQPAALTVGDYFPIADDTKYTYQGEGNEYAAYVAYNDYTAENKLQQRIDNGGTVVARVFVLADGQLIQTFASGENYQRENYLEQAGGAQTVLLMEPIAVGTAWTLADGGESAITDTAATVSTPAGDYQAVEVTTESDGNTTTRYFAPEVGLIKTVYVSDGNQISSTLSAVESDVPWTQTVRLFYPNVDEDVIYYQDRAVDFRTNEETKDILAAAYKQVPEGAVKVFSDNTAINSLYLGDDGIVYLDLSQDFLTEMNAGSGYEGMMLDCLADTFCGYYHTDKLILTIAGQPYLSGHFSFSPGEYLSADPAAAAQLP